MHTYEKTRREGEEDVPIPEFLSIDRSRHASLRRECVCGMQISPYANRASGGMQMLGTCAPRLFRTLFRPARRRWSGTRPIFACLGYFLSLCIGTIVPWVPGWDADSYVHDGSKPLIRISHWIEPVLGLTDCLECSQDRSFRLLNVFRVERVLADVFVHQLNIKRLTFFRVEKSAKIKLPESNFKLSHISEFLLITHECATDRLC